MPQRSQVCRRSVVHRVTPINNGERSIIKFVYTTTLDKTEEYYDNLLTYS